jgi:hypothetical protein
MAEDEGLWDANIVGMSKDYLLLSWFIYKKEAKMYFYSEITLILLFIHSLFLFIVIYLHIELNCNTKYIFELKKKK